MADLRPFPSRMAEDSVGEPADGEDRLRMPTDHSMGVGLRLPPYPVLPRPMSGLLTRRLAVMEEDASAPPKRR